eukprot:CAMPEP_0169176196 /NCGR_PEP_ID=MMETSP1015-20121227/65697_1 /TAXON_ID=342587 /ORGANISM="Karlodinium micrum, Strain CCMP2283" /LENGTH=51 /DNA_ID=CAMNT_0009250599 /DNA_START=72 /DNA_END=227 /DNA_ORIENTATION=+
MAKASNFARPNATEIPRAKDTLEKRSAQQVDARGIQEGGLGRTIWSNSEDA